MILENVKITMSALLRIESRLGQPYGWILNNLSNLTTENIFDLLIISDKSNSLSMEKLYNEIDIDVEFLNTIGELLSKDLEAITAKKKPTATVTETELSTSVS
jgi:hypothetical protein